jgi:hypothetical protein
LPSDPDALRAFTLACRTELAAATAQLRAAKFAVQGSLFREHVRVPPMIRNIGLEWLLRAVQDP